MATTLKNILVPVDFTVSTEVAVKKAIELIQANDSVIHLVHVKNKCNTWNRIGSGKSSNSASDEDYDRVAMQKLAEWQGAIVETIPETRVKIYFLEGSIHARIVETAIETNAQLIIIVKKRSRKIFEIFEAVYPNRLARATACPVLTILRTSLYSKIKTIIVPVRSFIPYRKIELAIAFAKKNRARIHVVTLQNKMAAWNKDRNYVVETYLLFKSRLTNAVEYHILNGTNLPKATLNYAEYIGADLILANPYTETKTSGLPGRHINDLLFSSSKLAIITVDPYADE